MTYFALEAHPALVFADGLRQIVGYLHALLMTFALMRTEPVESVLTTVVAMRALKQVLGLIKLTAEPTVFGRVKARWLLCMMLLMAL